MLINKKIISGIIGFMFLIITSLYFLNIIAMHYIFGMVSCVILFFLFLISLTKIKIPFKQIVILSAGLVTFISVFVIHFIISQNPFVYKYSKIDGGVEITGYKCRILNNYSEYFIDIPAEIKGHKVKAIGERAFYQSNHIKNIIIPDGVDIIKEMAFYRVDFEILEFPSSLKIIEKYAFNQVSFTAGYVMLPSGLEYVGEGAFSFGARSIIVPSDINTENWDNAWSSFGVCYNVIDVQTVGDVVYALKSDRTATVVYIDEKSLNIKIQEKLTYNNVEYPVTIIGEYAGANCTFEEIVIPRTIEIIKREAFCYNRNLKSIYIPNTVLIIENEIFRACHLLTVDVEHSEKPDLWSDYWYSGNVNWDIKNE